ncbi:hypothetical protein LCGC14_2427850, partial [marine sediment metagenome]
LAIGFALLCLPISSTSLITVEELQEILLTWELGSRISREGLAQSRDEVTGLKAELTAYELTEKMLREESRGLKADSTKLTLDLTSMTKRKNNLETSFDDYKGQIRSEVAALVLRYRIYIAISLAVGAAGLLVAILK